MSDRAIDNGPIESLVERAQAGDRDAFGQLYRNCYAPVFRLARFHLPGDAVEDAVAETFLRAWVSLPRYRNIGRPFGAWLAGIARHVVADAHRAAHRMQPTPSLPDRVVEFDGLAADRMTLAAAVARLPKEQQLVIEMKFLMAWRNEEVARALGKSVGAVNALQWRALAGLRRILEA